MLRSAVDRRADGEALVELGDERVTYWALWNRPAWVAGGLRTARFVVDRSPYIDGPLHARV